MAARTSALRTALALVVLAETGGAQGAEAPGTLACRVVRVEASGEQVLLLEVEVKNGGERFAEPAKFSVRLAGEEHEVRRFPLPETGRRGRAVPAGGTRRYWLQVATSHRPRGRSGIDVDVTSAVLHDGPALDEAPLAIRSIRGDRVEEAGMRFDAAVLEVESTLDRPVDAVLLALCEEPVRGRWLFPVHVEPGAGTLTIHEAASALSWNLAGGSVLGVRIRKAEVVDWTAVYEVPDAPVLGAFARAWESWRRWETPPAGWGGTFVLTTRRTSNGDTARETRRGRFRIGADGEASIEVDEVAGTEDRSPPRAVFALTFRDLRRPSLEELEKARGVRPFSERRVQVPDPRSRDELGDLFEVDGERIVASGVTQMGDDLRWSWTLEPLGDGYVVARREQWQKALGTTIRERRTHVVLPNGVVFPRSLVRDESWGDLVNVYELVLDDLAPATELADAPPTGAAADALRAVWAAPYRYPDARVDLTADFEVDHPNTDGVWGGVRRVRGSLRFGGFRGFSMHGGGWQSCTVDVEGAKLSEGARAAVANALEDRLGLWAGRDFGGRAPFDQAFRGATVREEGDGQLAITGGLAERVVFHDGLPREVWYTRGRRSTFVWAEVGGAAVPVEIRSGDEVLRARFRALDGGLVVPVEIRMENVFGAGWGPEKVTLTHVRVEKAR